MYQSSFIKALWKNLIFFLSLCWNQWFQEHYYPHYTEIIYLAQPSDNKQMLDVLKLKQLAHAIACLSYVFINVQWFCLKKKIFWHRCFTNQIILFQAKMTQLPEAEKEKIAEQVADFKKVKSKLDAEIEIWDDTSNDIIVLAKRMCVIMMEMTDFTR